MKPREIKAQMEGVKGIVKITSSMGLLSATKINKSSDAFKRAVLYKETLNEVLKGFLPRSSYFAENEGKKRYVIVVAGDRGLCGDYNLAVMQGVKKFLSGGYEKIFAIGQKTAEGLSDFPTEESYISFNNDDIIANSTVIAEEMLTAFDEKKCDSVYIIYTDCTSSLNMKVVAERMLPLNYDGYDNNNIIMEWSEADRNIAKSLLIAGINTALTSAIYGENYKRMVAMQSATGNGKELIEELTLQYQQKRQNDITTELNDAVTAGRSKNI